MMIEVRINGGSTAGEPRRLQRTRIAGLMASMEEQATGLSEQTTWMLAVRDTGDRAAFARLFDSTPLR